MILTFLSFNLVFIDGTALHSWKLNRWETGYSPICLGKSFTSLYTFASNLEHSCCSRGPELWYIQNKFIQYQVEATTCLFNKWIFQCPQQCEDKIISQKHGLCNIWKCRFVSMCLMYVVLINIYIKWRYTRSLWKFLLSFWVCWMTSVS